MAFTIITLVQTWLLPRAERVAEVSARFTLDALPGKQMSSDADLNAGLIDANEAKERRKKLERESQFLDLWMVRINSLKEMPLPV